MLKAVRTLFAVLALCLATFAGALMQGCNKGDDENAPAVGEIRGSDGKPLSGEAKKILEDSKKLPPEPSPFQKGPPK